MNIGALRSRELYIAKRLREIDQEKFIYDVENIDDFMKLEALKVEQYELQTELGQVRLAILKNGSVATRGC